MQLANEEKTNAITSLQVSPQINLHPLTPSLAKPLYPIIDRNRSLLETYLYWVAGVADIASTEAYIDKRVNSGLPGAQWFAIYFDDSIAGVFGIKSINHTESNAEVGYWLDADVHGQGIITRSIAAVSHYLHKNHDIHYLEISCLEDNRASMAVARRIGGTLNKVIPDYHFINGLSQSLHIYRAALPLSLT